jgi:hypothetical protein
LIVAGLMNVLNRLRGDAAILLLVAVLTSYVVGAALIAIYSAWTVLRPVSEAVAK